MNQCVPDPWHYFGTDTDPRIRISEERIRDPALFVGDLQDVNKKINYYLFKVYYANKKLLFIAGLVTYTSLFTDKKS
jgi:hypothetical protein